MSGGTPFVGRAQPLGELRRVAADAVEGRGAILLVAGEPGIGKTTLVAQAATQSPELQTVWGNCWDGDGAPPLWPWIQIVRSLHAEDAAPTLRRLLPGLGDAPVAGDEHARFQLFDAIAALLRVRSAGQPLFVVLDDLHWADTSTLLLLAFLVGEIRGARIAIVGTYRDVETPPSHPLHRLLSGRVPLVQLAGLNVAEVAEMGRFAAEDAAAIHRATGGNPFFVREMVRFPQRGALPESIGEVIRRRVERLSPQARAMLEAAAVLGQRFRADALARMVEVRPFAEAMSARLIEEDCFPHAVVREALLHALPRERRIELHRRAAETLEALGAGDAELAHHFGHAAMAGKAAEYAAKAGQRALEVFAYDEAAAHFERALTFVADRERRAQLLLSLGRALRAAGRAPEAHAAFEEVARLASDPALIAAAALSFGVEFTAGVVDHTEVRLLEQALSSLPPGDHPLRARVLARLAKALLFTPDAARRSALSESAAAMARRIGDAATLAAVLYDRHVAIWGGANAEERLAISTEVVQLAARCGDDELSLQGRALRMGNLLELGELAALQAEIDAYDALTTRLRQPQYLWHVPLLRATLAAFACRFDAAEQLANEGAALSRRAQHQGLAVFYPAVMATIRFVQGRFAEAEPALRKGAEQFPSLPTWRSALSFALFEAGRDEEARAELERLTAAGFANVPRDFTWVASLSFMSLTAAGLGDARAAAALYDLLLPYRAFCVRLTRIGICGVGAVAHYLGLLAATMGRAQEAERHFAHAIETNQRIGAPAFVANSRLQYARVLRDASRAKEESDRARNAAAALGFALLLDRAAPRSESFFRREGDTWAVQFGGRLSRLKESVGLAYIARLIAEPDRDLHVLDLSGATSETGMPVLDGRAKADFRRRLDALEDEARESEERHDAARAARAREEMEAIAEQLAQAVGLGGRDRLAASQAERARVRVTKAIKAAIRRIAEHDTALADHLERSIRTGALCCYAPDPSAKIRWVTT